MDTDGGGTYQDDVSESADYIASSGNASNDSIDPWVDGPNIDTDNGIYGGDVYTGTVFMSGYFPMRGNTMKVIIPFQYVVGGAVFKLSDIQSHYTNTQPQINVIGPALGYLGQRYQTINIPNPGRAPGMVTGNSEGSVIETRVITRTSSGRTIISITFEDAVGRLEEDETITRQANSNTSFQYSAIFNIQAPSNLWTKPSINYNFSAVSTGVQRN